MPKRDEIITEAKKWIDTPYKHAGRNKYGIDCVGPIIKVAHALGISKFDIINYPQRPTGNHFLDIMGKHMKRIPLENAKNGDVIVCRSLNNVCHSGFLEVDPLGQRWFIHAYRPVKKVIREATTPELENSFVFAFQYYGVED